MDPKAALWETLQTHQLQQPNRHPKLSTIQICKFCGAPKDVWAREFVGTKSTFSPHPISILPTFSPHFDNKLPIPTNYQLIVNYLSMFLTKVPHYSTIYHHFLHFKINNISSSCQCTRSLWGDLGDHFDVGRTWEKCRYISLPYSAPNQLFHCG